jgi:bifunctional DNA-binding transcriptional regulator/antitoxin component of YhaV-PrlF toxin-antitoxin module
MTTSGTAILSGNGQIHIPQDILETLHWHEGIELKLTATEQGVLLEAKSNRRGRRLEDLIGMLQHDGPTIPIEELCIYNWKIR